MTAEKLFDDKFKNSSSIITGYKKEIVALLEEFATEKCQEQKRICFEETIKEGYTFDCILYSPMPEM